MEITIEDFDKVEVRIGTSPEQLVGQQAVFCVNLKPMHIGSVKSEVRILFMVTKKAFQNCFWKA